MLGWFRDLTAKERSTMLACFGGWSLDAFDVQMYSFVIPTVIALWGLSQGRGRADRHRDPADLVVRRLVQRHPRRPLRPGEDAADHDPVVLGLHLPVRLRPEFRAALHPARAARLRLRRRVGGRRGADGRGHPRQVPRPRRSGWCRPAGRSAGARRRWSTPRVYWLVPEALAWRVLFGDRAGAGGIRLLDPPPHRRARHLSAQRRETRGRSACRICSRRSAARICGPRSRCR